MYNNRQCLLIDEADRIWNIGFDEEMKKIEFGTLNSTKK